MDAIKHIIPLVIIIFLVAAGSWYFTRAPIFSTVQIKTGQAIEVVYATAVVEPEIWASVAPTASGRISEIYVREGDLVKAGDILAWQDDAGLRAQLEEERVLRDYYSGLVSRQAPLLSTGATSLEEYEENKAFLAQAEARIAMLEGQIRQLALISPLDGMVLWRDVEPGEVKSETDQIFWVGKPQPLRLEAEVDEEDIPKVRVGQKALITADAFPQQALDGTVSFISPKGDPVSKSYRVYISLPPDTPLMIGMTVETNIIIYQKENVLLLPVEALVDGQSVWQVVKQNGKLIAQQSPVATGIRGEDKLELLSGLEAGDRVIMPPFDDLAEGQAIKVTDYAVAEK